MQQIARPKNGIVVIAVKILSSLLMKKKHNQETSTAMDRIRIADAGKRLRIKHEANIIKGPAHKSNSSIIEFVVGEAQTLKDATIKKPPTGIAPCPAGITTNPNATTAAIPSKLLAIPIFLG